MRIKSATISRWVVLLAAVFLVSIFSAVNCNPKKTCPVGSIDYYVEHLRSNVFADRQEAAKKLGELQAKQAIPALVQAMQDKHWQLSRYVCYVFKVKGGGMTFRDRYHCQLAAIALGEIGGEIAVEALKNELNKNNIDTSNAAAIALGNCGDMSVLPCLERARNSPWVDADVAEMAIQKIRAKYDSTSNSN